MNKHLVTWLSLSAAVVLSVACGDNSSASQPVGTPGEAGTQAANAAGTAATSPAAAGGSAAGTAAAAPAPGQGGAGSAGRAVATAGTGSAASGMSGAAGAAGTAAPAAAGAPAAGSGGAAGEAPVEPAKLRRAVSADFLEQTLSIVDVDKLKEGGKRGDALIGKVDLSMFSPGPLAVAVTPDGKTAVVSISAGWLGLVGTDVPAGDGTLVFVDLEQRKVLGDLDVGRNPMGIAITKDGKYGFVGLMSENYMAYVDIEKRTYTRISTGNSWNEELAIDDTGKVGALTTGIAGDAMTFSVDSPSMTKGQTRGLSADAGGVAFFPGTLFAFVVQAPTPLTSNLGGYNVIDATDPSAPKSTDNVRVMNDMRIAYPVTSVPNRKSVVYPSTEGGKLYLLEMGLENGKAKQVQKLEAGAATTLAYGLSSSAEGLVLAVCGTDRNVYVADLNTGKAFTVPWETTKTGPMDIKYIP